MNLAKPYFSSQVKLAELEYLEAWKYGSITWVHPFLPQLKTDSC